MQNKKLKLESFGFKEINIGEERIGLQNAFFKLVLLNPRSMINKEQISDYDEVVSQLKNKSYKISYTSAEKSEKLSREKFYDILM